MENHEGVSKNTIWKIKKDKVRIQFGRLRRSKVRIQFGRSRSKVRIQLQIRVEQKIYILLLALLNIQEVELNSFQTVYILFRISSIHPSKSQPITAQSSTSQHFPAHPSTIYSTSQHITAHTIADPSTSQQIPWHIPAHPTLQPLYRKNTTFNIILICSSWSGLQYGPSNLWG